MSSADIIWGIFLLAGAYQGYKKGFILEVIAMVAFVLAVIGGFKLLEVGISIMEPFAGSLGKMLPIISFILIFLLILGAVNFIGKGLKKVVEMALLGGFDKLAGGIIGLLKWGLGASVVIWFLETISIGLPGFISGDSVLFNAVRGIAPQVGKWLIAVFPSFNEFFEVIDEKLQNFGN